ncbi:MAG TPA: hypothetical protein VFR75_05285, partial [Solirubrobacterales bacterium]|nr:hypothetical protein [Solirubrobacterales bacterium]
FVAVAIPGAVGLKWVLDGGMGLPFVALMGYLELVAVLVLMLSRLRLRDLQAELRTVEFENEILEQSEKSPILLFLKHQAELKRYYDQALQQSGLAFVLGVICVASGLAVVGAGFVLLQEGDSTQGIATAALAAVGALLSGFVARVYLGIHRGAVESLTGFHEKFVETHHLHVAGVFASRVEDDARKDDTLLALVKAAANRNSGDASVPPS